MEPEANLTAASLRAPRAAAVAVFPIWVLLISVYILIGNLRRPERTRS